jgi:hypothetical protein
MGLEINTINDYFSKIYEKPELEKFNEELKAKLLSYKFPSEICLSSDYLDTSTLLGTLTFQELDVRGYPIYTGDVVKSEGVFLNTTYSTILIFDRGRWVFTLTQPKDEEALDIIISSSLTTSLDPTKVDYDGISRPTSGACRRSPKTLG